MASEDLRQSAVANTLENFGYLFKKRLEGLFIDRMEQNEEIAARFMNEEEFKKLVSEHLLHKVYDQFKAGNQAAEERT